MSKTIWLRDFQLEITKDTSEKPHKYTITHHQEDQALKGEGHILYEAFLNLLKNIEEELSE